MSNDIEELENLKSVFQKCADIVGKCIELAKKIDETEDEEEIKKLNEEVENQTGLLMVQMIKLNKLSK